MTSGPVVVQVLEGEDAVQRNRDVMGATNPANADAGTIRKELAGIDRGQFGPRFGQRRKCGDRNRLLLQAGRNRRLIAFCGGFGAKPPPFLDLLRSPALLSRWPDRLLG